MTLDEIAIKHNCDKSSLHHDYCKIYEQYLRHDQGPVKLLEIGYGGYDDPNAGGESMLTWEVWYAYNNCSVKLIAIDIFDKVVRSGIMFYKTPQSNPFLIHYPDVWGVNVIIDDGSHLNADIIKTFQNLFPALAPGGLYFVEDLHSSYDEFYPDSDEVPGTQGTAMEFFTSIAHQVNKDFIKTEYHLEYDIEFIHFYKEFVVIKKK